MSNWVVSRGGFLEEDAVLGVGGDGLLVGGVDGVWCDERGEVAVEEDLADVGDGCSCEGVVWEDAISLC